MVAKVAFITEPMKEGTRFLKPYGYIKFFDELLITLPSYVLNSGVPRNFFSGGGGGGVHQIHLRTEDRENGDLGAVAP